MNLVSACWEKNEKSVRSHLNSLKLCENGNSILQKLLQRNGKGVKN